MIEKGMERLETVYRRRCFGNVGRQVIVRKGVVVRHMDFGRGYNI
jgi:hypothetical protein